jgi:hypothetical protein
MNRRFLNVGNSGNLAKVSKSTQATNKRSCLAGENLLSAKKHFFLYIW